MLPNGICIPTPFIDTGEIGLVAVPVAPVVVSRHQGIAPVSLLKFGVSMSPQTFEWVPDWIAWARFVGYGAFAASAGTCGHLLRTMDEGKPVKWGRAALEGASAGFVGVLVLLVCQAMALSEEWTGLIVGVSGWLGANATVRLLERIILKKLGLTEKGDTRDH